MKDGKKIIRNLGGFFLSVAVILIIIFSLPKKSPRDLSGGDTKPPVQDEQPAPPGKEYVDDRYHLFLPKGVWKTIYYRDNYPKGMRFDTKTVPEDSKIIYKINESSIQYVTFDLDQDVWFWPKSITLMSPDRDVEMDFINVQHN